MRKTIVLIVALFPLFAFAQGHQDNFNHEWKNLGITEDMSTTQVVSWKTPAEITGGAAQIAPATVSPNIECMAEDVEVSNELFENEGLTFCYHRAYFKDLKPSTAYMYRVGDGNGIWSEWSELKTAGSRTETFKFVYFGDVQNGIPDSYPRLPRTALMTAPDAALYIFAGDLTGQALCGQYDQFFKHNGWMLAQKAVAPVPDNHEYVKDPKTGVRIELNKYWTRMFAYPCTEKKELMYDFGSYVFDYQDCRFIMLNSRKIEDLKEDEFEWFKSWFEEQVDNNPYDWTVVVHHKPVYPAKLDRDPIPRIKELQKIYEAKKVDLVLTGHDHVYTRQASRDEKNRKCTPVYLISFAGQKANVANYSKEVDRMGSDAQFFQVVEVSPDAIIFNTYDVLGDLYDSFSILKKKSGKKLFKDKAPSTPERTVAPENHLEGSPAEELQLIDSLKTEYEKFRGYISR